MPGFVHTLQTTISVFAHHPMPVFACAMLLFAGAGVLSSLIYAALVGQAVMQAVWNTNTSSQIYNVQLLVQATIGTFTLLLGRGALTWIALNASPSFETTAISFRAALREALRRWQPLLISSVLYGVLISLGTFGLTVLLRELRLDVSNARWLRGDLDSVLNWTLVRSIGALLPDPGAPFAESIAAAKYNLARTSSSGYFGFDYYSRFSSHDASPGLWLLGAGSALFLIACDVVLCLRTAAIVASVNSQQTPTAWLPVTLRLGLRHFGQLLVWRWVLRLTTALLVTLTLVLLPALHQMTVMNQVRQAIGTGYWPYYIAQAGYGFVGALVGSVLIAFSVVFEARAFLALKHT